MRKHIAVLLSVMALILGLSQPSARALQAHDPSALINTLVSEAIANIKDQKAAQSDREAKFRTLLETGFDIPRISRFVLGRYWNVATDQERQAFASLFEDWIVGTYSARFTQYSGEVIRVTGTRDESETSSIVMSEFTSPNGAPPAKIEWHVRKEADGDFKVIDVAVEGISMALTERDEIATVADRNGGTVAGLTKALQDKLAGVDTAAK
jgi:phospholipid transport system substrate-binding protein